MEQRRPRRRQTTWLVVALPLVGVAIALAFILRDNGTVSGASLRRVDWSSASVPASSCGGGGSVRVRDGVALVSSSRWRDAWRGLSPATKPDQVELSVGDPVRYGDLGADGSEEAIVPIWCTNGGGTAAGQLGQALVVFSLSNGRPAVMAIVTTSQPDTQHTPYFANRRTRIAHDGITVEELWYGSNDSTCCPTGRAETMWSFTGATLIPGTPRVTAYPEMSSDAPTVVEPFDPLPCDRGASDTLSIIGCIQQSVIEVDGQIDTVAARIFDRLSHDTRRRFETGVGGGWSSRLAVCESRADVFEGGSAARIETAACFLARSKEHLADLNAFDASLPHSRQ